MINRNYKLALILMLALALRLLVWRWRDQYPLGGDEQEYLAQALTFLQERRYTELRFMRPPLYTGFLIATIYLFDSLIQHIRLAQAVISTLTILPIYAVVRVLFPQRVALIAALLTALSYTLAATATELLSETLFLFGLACSLWLLTLAASIQHQWSVANHDESSNLPSAPPIATSATPAHTPIWGALLAGGVVGALALIRSVALPLILLGAVWLLNEKMRAGSTGQQANPISQHPRMRGIIQITHSSQLALAFLLAAILTIAPWTARNYTTYGGFILIDTTGAENLWLDNDPAGREEVKRQLYAIGEDRLARQRLASQQGIAVISSDFPRFLGKAASEVTHFFALQYYDDLRDRPAIWVAPPDVWARLLLGDALWLLVLFAGVTGFWRAPQGRPDLRWIAIPWALYTLLTACIFHVELRYRLPLWPVLVPYAAWIVDHLVRSRSFPMASAELRLPPSLLRSIGMLCCLGILITLTLLHRPYLTDSAVLAVKHLALARANAALEQGQDPGWDRELQANDALWAAGEALRIDPRSALARIALARSAIRAGDVTTALRQLRDAEDTIRAHPQPHLLRGAILLSQGDSAEAQREFRYETDSLEDLQAWSWQVFPDILPAPTRINIGDGLDLGHIQGFYAAESAGTRWTTSRASIRLHTPGQPATLSLRVNGSRPSGAAPAQLTIRSTQSSQINSHYVLTTGWQTITIPIRPDSTSNTISITLEASTFRPRSFDRTSPDNRDLGIQVDWVEVSP